MLIWGFLFVLIGINGDTIAQAVYIEAIAMVEEYQQAVSVAALGGIRDVQGLYPQLGLRSLPQVPNTQLMYSISEISFWKELVQTCYPRKQYHLPNLQAKTSVNLKSGNI